MRLKWMMTNSKGKEDSMLTFAFLSFMVVSVVILLSVVKSFTVKGAVFEFHPPNDTLLLGYLATCFGGYVTRRYHDEKLAPKPTDGAK